MAAAPWDSTGIYNGNLRRKDTCQQPFDIHTPCMRKR
jgi:hypothetical protein